MKDIQLQDATFCRAYDLLKDSRDEEEFESQWKRHFESLDIMDFISSNMSGLRSAIEERQRDTKREGLLQWLSSVDPSENYNNACERHEAGTGQWFIVEDSSFKDWKQAANSLLWLYGKGTYIF